jgi:hypothetical protein
MMKLEPPLTPACVHPSIPACLKWELSPGTRVTWQTLYAKLHSFYCQLLGLNQWPLLKTFINYRLRVNTSLGNPQVKTGISVGNPWVNPLADLSFYQGQVCTDLGVAISESRYLPQVLAKSINILAPFGPDEWKVFQISDSPQYL